MRCFIILFFAIMSLAGCMSHVSDESEKCARILFRIPEQEAQVDDSLLIVFEEAFDEYFASEERELVVRVLRDADIVDAYEKLIQDPTPSRAKVLKELVGAKGATEVFGKFSSAGFQELMSRKNQERAAVSYERVMGELQNIQHEEDVLE